MLLGSPNSIVLTKRVANILFGNDTVAGQTIDSSFGPLQVTAVIDNFRENTYLTNYRASVLLSIDALPDEQRHGNQELYLKFQNETAVAQAQQKIADIIPAASHDPLYQGRFEQFPEYQAARRELVPVIGISLHNDWMFTPNEFQTPGGGNDDGRPRGGGIDDLVL